MYKLSIILSAVFLFVGCQNATTYTDDLAGKKKELADKRGMLKELQTQVDMLKAEISELEPTKEKRTSVVATDTIAMKTFERFVKVQGAVMSDELVYASSEIPGRLLSVQVKEGQRVSRGSLIATVDVDALNKQVDELKTSMDLANTVYQKQKRLWDQNIGSEIQYLQAKNNVERLEKSLATLQANLAKRNVYSPITGVVQQEFLKAGELANPGMPIVQILNTNKLKVIADVPENYLKNIKKGDKVEVNLPAVNKTIDSRISLVGSSINPSNRTFKVEVNTGSMRGLLKPNLLADLTFRELAIKDAIQVPASIVLEQIDGSKYVYVAKKEGKDLIAAKALISVGESADGYLQVTGGLKPGDLIITKGARSVNVGDRLIVQ